MILGSDKMAVETVKQAIVSNIKIRCYRVLLWYASGLVNFCNFVTMQCRECADFSSKQSQVLKGLLWWCQSGLLYLDYLDHLSQCQSVYILYNILLTYSYFYWKYSCSLVIQQMVTGRNIITFISNTIAMANIFWDIFQILTTTHWLRTEHKTNKNFKRVRFQYKRYIERKHSLWQKFLKITPKKEEQKNIRLPNK